MNENVQIKDVNALIKKYDDALALSQKQLFVQTVLREEQAETLISQDDRIKSLEKQLEEATKNL